MKFKNIILSTLPSNILDNKVSLDVVNILLDYIEQNSYVSFDISEIYKNPSTAIKKELIKIYINNLYSSFQKAITDENIIKVLSNNFYINGSIEKQSSRLTYNTLNNESDDLILENSEQVLYEDGNIVNFITSFANETNAYLLTQNKDYINSIIATVLTFDMNYFLQLEEYLNEEYIYSSKAFKQKKGTALAIKYAYSIFRQNGIQNDGYNGTGDNYSLLDHNYFSVEYGSYSGIKKITAPYNYESISFFTITNSTKIPNDALLIFNKNIIKNNIEYNVKVGYRFDSLFYNEEFSGSNLNLYSIDRGASIVLTPSYDSTSFDIYINGVESNNILEPYTYIVKGTLYPEIFENAIKDIVHPIGFQYIYEKIFNLYLQDTLSGLITYNDVVIYVTCDNNTNIDNYTDSVANIVISYDGLNNVKKEIYFNNGKYLILDYNKIITYYNIDGSINKEYTNTCFLYLSYSTNVGNNIIDSAIYTSNYISKEYVNSIEIDSNLNTQNGLDILLEDGSNISVGIAISTLEENIGFTFEYFFIMTTEDGSTFIDEENNSINML